MSIFISYRSIADLARLISNSEVLSKLEFDVVVGIQRSGVLAASMIALHHNRPLVDLNSFIAGTMMSHGRTREPVGFESDPRRYRRPLIVDDSVFTGQTMTAARNDLSGIDGEPTYLAAYVSKRSREHVDHALEIVQHPRVFEWNMWHSWLCSRACFDLDGIICPDPTKEQNDDGPRYARFIEDAPALTVPTQPLAHIVTGRLEKYRPQTEAWLKDKTIPYDNLHMLDLPAAKQRRQLKLHAEFKASVYARVNAELFVESEPWQATEIARRSGKPALNFPERTICYPDRISVNLAAEISKRQVRGLKRSMMRLIYPT